MPLFETISSLVATNALARISVNTTSQSSSGVVVNTGAASSPAQPFSIPISATQTLSCTIDPSGPPAKGKPCKRACPDRWCTWSRGIYNPAGECVRPGVRCSFTLPGTKTEVPGRWNAYGDCQPSSQSLAALAATATPKPAPAAVPATPVAAPAAAAPAAAPATAAAPAVAAKP